MGSSLSVIQETIIAASAGNITNAEFSAWIRQHNISLSPESKESIDKFSSEEGTLSKESLVKLLEPLGERETISETALSRFPVDEIKGHELDLADEDYSITEIKVIVALLKGNTTVTHFDIGLNSLPDDGVAILLKGLAGNKTIKEFKLTGNRIRQPTTAAALVEFVVGNPVLVDLQIAEVGLNNDSAVVLAQLLEKNSTVTDLDLAGNLIGPVGAAAFAKGLTTNTHLKDLNMDGNGVGDDGAIAFAEALKTNKTLTILNINSRRDLDAKDVRVNITSTGATALAEALKVNHHLSEIHLECNQIDDDGIIQLATCLEDSKNIVFVGLEDNTYGDLGEAALAKAKQARGDSLRFTINSSIPPPPPPSDDHDVPPPPPPTAFKPKRGDKFQKRRESMTVDGDQHLFVLSDNPLMGIKEEGKKESAQSKLAALLADDSPAVPPSEPAE